MHVFYMHTCILHFKSCLFGMHQKCHSIFFKIFNILVCNLVYICTFMLQNIEITGAESEKKLYMSENVL